MKITQENNNFSNKIIEPFDGIRKNNSLLIFKILLIIIIVDVAIDCFS